MKPKYSVRGMGVFNINRGCDYVMRGYDIIQYYQISLQIRLMAGTSFDPLFTPEVGHNPGRNKNHKRQEPLPHVSPIASG